MNLKGGYKIISLMAITLIAGAVGGDRTPITDEGILEQLDSLKEFLDESKQLKPILLRVKDSGNEVVMANLSKKTGEDILYINADLVDASLNVMVKFAQDEETQEIYIDEASYLYIADVDTVAGEVAKAEEGTIVDVLGLDEDGKLVKDTFNNLDIGGIITLPNMIVDVELTSAMFQKELTKAEYDKIPDNGLVIIMFNTTCVIIPYVKGVDNRFVCNAVYNTNYDAMVVRGKIRVHYEDVYSVFIRFNDEYATALLQNPTVRPYAIIRFIGF